MRTYSAFTNRTLSSTSGSNTLLQLLQPASALKRLALTFWEMHSDASSDNAFTNAIQRVTAAGSGGSTFTPLLNDPADGPASAIVRTNDTSNPTITSNSQVLTLGGHQRSTLMWYAPQGGEIIVPLSNNAGLVTITTVVSTGFNQVQTIQWTE